MKIYTRVFIGLAAAGLTLSSVLSASAAAGSMQAVPVSCSQGQRDLGLETLLTQTIDELLSAGHYSEGEAITVVRGTAKPDIAGEKNLLMHLEADAVAGAVAKIVADPVRNGDKSVSLSAELARLRMQENNSGKTGHPGKANSSEKYSIWQVSDHSKTTEELLLELYADPEVISAEPNYQATAAQASQTEAEAAGSATPQASPAKSAAQDAPAQAAPGDLSALQWDLANTSDTYTTPLSPSGGYSLGVPGWKEGHLTESAPANASGTICIMDTGIDTDHPDLQGVLYEFAEEQQAKYGCG